jgi:hypothetical protein
MLDERILCPPSAMASPQRCASYGADRCSIAIAWCTLPNARTINVHLRPELLAIARGELPISIAKSGQPARVSAMELWTIQQRSSIVDGFTI